MSHCPYGTNATELCVWHSVMDEIKPGLVNELQVAEALLYSK